MFFSKKILYAENKTIFVHENIGNEDSIVVFIDLFHISIFFIELTYNISTLVMLFEFVSLSRSLIGEQC